MDNYFYYSNISKKDVIESFNENSLYENFTQEETLVEEAPVEEAPVEEAPVEETPVEETPVEETPVEETPVEETQNEESSESDNAPEPQVLAKIRPDIDIKYLMLTAAERKTIDEVVSAIYPTFILFNYITTKFDIISYRYNISKEYTTFSVVVKTNKMYEKEDKNELLTIKKFPDGKTELENPKNISFTSGIAVSIYFIVLIILLIILLS